MECNLPWWKRAVLYQIYPRSFADASGDGVGDLAGILRNLDHLSWLGVDGLWLLPIYPSPMADFGYDVANFTDIDPVFGTMEDFDELLAAAHRRDLRVLLDWVPNHTSDRHPWFMASRGSRGNPYRDWYWWRDTPGDVASREPGGDAAAAPQPRAWRAGPAWTLDQRTGQSYLHHFLPRQPDLNWSTPAVREAMYDTLRFWLDRGVDGFGAGAIHLIGNDPAAADDRSPRTHQWLREIRAVLDVYGDRMMVGGIDLADPATVATYTGDDQLHLACTFNLLRAAWDAAAFRDVIADVEAAASTAGSWPCWVLSNHDASRHRTRYGGSEARARVAAVVLLTLRGTPVLYAGEELGLEDAIVPPEHAVDHGPGRDPSRAPIPWHGRAGHGWNGETPWLPWPPDAGTRNAAAQRRDHASIAGLYQRLLRRRRADAVLQAGDLQLCDVHADVLAYDRVSGTDHRRVLANFGDAPVTVDAGTWTVLVATHHERDGTRFDGRLAGCEAVVLGPEA